MNLEQSLTLIKDRRTLSVCRQAGDLIVTCTSPESALTLQRDLKLVDINAISTTDPYILIVRPEQ